jgi:drug/metabolite transporter (DMT)-like permease
VTAALFLLIFLSESFTIAGQLFMKHAMAGEHGSRGKFLRAFATAIACMAAGFFIWTFLMQKFDLSFLYPFDGLNRVLLVLGATVFLKEKTSPALWLGVALISVGVGLVSAS